MLVGSNPIRQLILKQRQMKKVILLILMAYYMQATAQHEFKTVFGIGLDPKMAIAGPYPDRPDNKPSLDYEVSFGFDWENTRIMMQLKSHKDINFFKWTYMQVDYKLNPKFWLFGSKNDNLFIYSGLEVGQIRKTHPDYHYTDVDNYRRVTINPFILGANLELQYKVMDDAFGVGLQSSLYQAEDDLKPYKKYRFDVTLNIYFYL